MQIRWQYGSYVLIILSRTRQLLPILDPKDNCHCSDVYWFLLFVYPFIDIMCSLISNYFLSVFLYLFDTFGFFRPHEQRKPFWVDKNCSAEVRSQLCASMCFLEMVLYEFYRIHQYRVRFNVAKRSFENRDISNNIISCV